MHERGCLRDGIAYGLRPKALGLGGQEWKGKEEKVLLFKCACMRCRLVR